MSIYKVNKDTVRCASARSAIYVDLRFAEWMRAAIESDLLAIELVPISPYGDARISIVSPPEPLPASTGIKYLNRFTRQKLS